MLQGYLDSTVPNSRLSNIETDKESNRNPNQYEYKYNNSHDSYKRQPSTQSLQNQVKASPTSSTSKERLM